MIIALVSWFEIPNDPFSRSELVEDSDQIIIYNDPDPAAWLVA